MLTAGTIASLLSLFSLWRAFTFALRSDEPPLELIRAEVWDKDPIGKNFLSVSFFLFVACFHSSAII